MKNIVLVSCSFLLGITFLFSAYTKLYPIELFEYTIVETGIFSWNSIPFVSRLLIGIEFLLGSLLLLNLYFSKKETLIFTALLLLFFTGYLIILLVKEGNEGNCGCFGDTLKLTPLESIFKNILSLLLVYLLYKFHTGIKLRFQKWLLAALLIASLVAPYIFTPINMMVREQSKEETLNYDLDLSALYDSSRTDKPSFDLMQGKRIIAFLSLTCPHCKLGAFKLHLMHKDNPQLPIYFILNGDEEKLPAFFEESKAADMPYSFMTEKEGFVKCAGVRLPAILWVNNGRVIKKVKYKYLNQSEIESWLSN